MPLSGILCLRWLFTVGNMITDGRLQCRTDAQTSRYQWYHPSHAKNAQRQKCSELIPRDKEPIHEPNIRVLDIDVYKSVIYTFRQCQEWTRNTGITDILLL